MKEIKIRNTIISLSGNGESVLVKAGKETTILLNQNVDTVAGLLEHNVNIVFNHYRFMIEKGEKAFDFSDVNLVSIAIVLYYLHMHNSWRTMYKKQENKDLRFNEKDFDHPYTHDILFNYFKSKYPKDWEEKCAVLLGMEVNELRAYYKKREDFYNK